jgi:hypothetical protein
VEVDAITVLRIQSPVLLLCCCCCCLLSAATCEELLERGSVKQPALRVQHRLVACDQEMLQRLGRIFSSPSQ